MIRGDATTNKLMSFNSVWKSHRPNSFKKAIEKIDELISDNDPNVALKASVYTIDQHQGKPAQRVDVTSDGERLPSPPQSLIVKVIQGKDNAAD
jgi:hypothetical protein